MASTTVMGAIVAQVRLKSYNWLSIVLIMLWCLSPIGGQATLRLLGVQQPRSYGTGTAWYLPTGSDVANSLGFASNGTNILGNRNSSFRTSNLLYTASLIMPSSRRDAATDLWGWPKVPRVDSPDFTKPDSDGWLKVTDALQYEAGRRAYRPGTKGTSWDSFRMDSSLLGLQFAYTVNDAEWTYTAPYSNLSFAVQYRYFDFDCFNFRHINTGNLSLEGREPIRDSNGTEYLGAFWSGINRVWNSSSGSDLGRGLLSNGSMLTSFFLDTNIGWDESVGYFSSCELFLPRLYLE